MAGSISVTTGDFHSIEVIVTTKGDPDKKTFVVPADTAGHEIILRDDQTFKIRPVQVG